MKLSGSICLASLAAGKFQELASLPPCATACLSVTTSASQSCNANDICCLCRQLNSSARVQRCLETTCAANDVDAINSAAIQLCSNVDDEASNELRKLKRAGVVSGGGARGGSSGSGGGKLGDEGGEGEVGGGGSQGSQGGEEGEDGGHNSSGQDGEGGDEHREPPDGNGPSSTTSSSSTFNALLPYTTSTGGIHSRTLAAVGGHTTDTDGGARQTAAPLGMIAAVGLVALMV